MNKDLIENINNLKVVKWLLVVPYPYTKKDASEEPKYTDSMGMRK